MFDPIYVHDIARYSVTCEMETIRIVCISDTHNHAPGEGYTLPRGDILIHAGDVTNQGTYAELEKAIAWLSKADFAVKVVVAGNHDISLDPTYSLKHEEGWKVLPADVEACRALFTDNPDIVYLQHSAATLHLPEKGVSLQVFGSPFSPERGKQNWAFQYENDAAEMLWDAVPNNTDILITHSPPKGICDASKHWREGGCRALSATLARVRPQLHVCGHCHEGRGAVLVHWSEESSSSDDVQRDLMTWQDPGRDNKKMSKFSLTDLESGRETGVINASIMGASHGRGTKIFNKPIVVDINVEKGSISASEKGSG